MGRVVVTNNVSLDGVMQAPARADEDIRGGFTRGGWAMGYDDAVKGQEMAKRIGRPGALLLGRRTYQDFAAVWPQRTNNPFTPVLERTQKYVVSRTLAGPLPWQNSTVLAGEAVQAVAGLKHDSELDLSVLGSGELIQSLRGAGLIDSYLLLIHPLILGAGRRLFPDGSPPEDLRLVDSVTTTKGVIIATYEVA